MGKKKSKQQQQPTLVAQQLSRQAVANPRKRAQEEESRFSKLSSAELETLNLIAHNTPLVRPIPSHLKHFHPTTESESESISLPKKPRWHHDLSAKAVQSNEDSVFQDWLNKADSIVRSRFPTVTSTTQSGDRGLLPCQFERNVQVYRQLWRVLERSHILLVLMDARCPLVHLPPSLESFLTRFANRRTILVLTKKDIVGDHIASQWQTYLQERYQWEVVVTESYQKRTPNEGQGKRSKFVPYLSPQSRTALFEAIQRVHKAVTTPPQRIRDDPDQLKQWKPPCHPNINWQAVQHHPTQTDPTPSHTLNEDSVTIGLIGQPNVGKSSLLNALLGNKVVHASKTPGKTKHFQTHSLYSHRVWLCDSPGLVFPNESIGQELQILNNILSIAQCQAVSTCIHYISKYLPLERILSLDYPDDEGEGWTAMKILEALAKRHNYKTAKAGRWDTNRAGNALLRSLAEARISWAFLPPPTAGEGDDDDGGNGVWIPNTSSDRDIMQEEEDSEQEDEQPRKRGVKKNVSFDLQSESEDNAEESEEEEEEEQKTTSMFDALAIEGGQSESDDDSSGEEDKGDGEEEE